MVLGNEVPLPSQDIEIDGVIEIDDEVPIHPGKESPDVDRHNEAMWESVSELTGEEEHYRNAAT